VLGVVFENLFIAVSIEWPSPWRTPLLVCEPVLAEAMHLLARFSRASTSLPAQTASEISRQTDVTRGCVLGPQFFADHRGKRLRFSHNGVDFYDGG
jgi:hypothetical protein